MMDLFQQDDTNDLEIFSRERICTVTQITREIKLILEGSFTSLWVEGELSNFKKHSSGHFYFSLKDSEAQISCVMWRGRNQSLLFQPYDGMKVVVLANVSVYEKQGRYQLDVIQMRPAGEGELQLAFEALKRKLDAEGLFLAENKMKLPLFPEKIGVVTSSTGAALQDIRSVLKRRFPSIQIILRPVRVQGESAAGEIAQALEDFNNYANVDVIIVGRGGGSLEDLWAFNEEIVARALFASKIPTISAVGHEIDFSISDFVADYRAPTPSAAAEIVVRNREELMASISLWKNQMIQCVYSKIQNYKEKISAYKRSYGIRWPLDRLREYRLRLDEASRHLELNVFHQHDRFTRDVKAMHEKLFALNPESVLKRGYSITTRISDQKIVTRSSVLHKKDQIHTQFADGAVQSIVDIIDNS